jgi:maltose alpha-D-glucosyltransferase/alpha-amylase
MHGDQYREWDIERLRPWARVWEAHVTAQYVGGYLEAVEGASFIPKRSEDTDMLLSFYGIEKAIYEIGYEMNNRPSWLPIPIAGLEAILDGEKDDS